MPAYGYIAIGVVDRGTNVLQVRPTTICPQNCIFCSVDAGLYSRNRWAEFIVDPEVIVRGVEEAISVKGCCAEALIDIIGDPLTYRFSADGGSLPFTSIDSSFPPSASQRSPRARSPQWLPASRLGF
ncbi:MAG: hypothetical protein LM569_01615, partial [Desulfurococcaceae archaeon]|nr:hypothetical protein [Desulfurococcaceae archaeon]